MASGDAYLSSYVEKMNYTDADLQRVIAAYFGTISFLDHIVGRLTGELIKNGVFENTLVIFTSDHGGLEGSRGFLRRGAGIFDDMVKVPMITVPPGGLSRPTVCNGLVSHVDLVQTLLDWCGVEIPNELLGVSIRKQMEGVPGSPRDMVTAEYHSNNWSDPVFPLRMLRTAEWKYIESGLGDHELYHLSNAGISPRWKETVRSSAMMDSALCGTGVFLPPPQNMTQSGLGAAPDFG